MANGGWRISRLSDGPSNPVWSVAVFAHNEAKTIRMALQSIAATVGGKAIKVCVLANGCTDATVAEVRACSDLLPNLWLAETSIADKAHAWNLYVHDILSADSVGACESCFFMDGDVSLSPTALPLLAAALDEVATAEAAGAMPATGRDRDAWRRRMLANGMLAGNCYALRGSFVQLLRERRIRMPIGLIGEDFFVSWLVANDVWRGAARNEEDARFVFHGSAEFAFRSLSPWRLADYRTYLRRKWRYTLRALQHQMLVRLLTDRGVSAMPVDVEELYCRAPLPSRMIWVGLDTPLRLVAAQWLRRVRKRAGKEKS